MNGMAGQFRGNPRYLTVPGGLRDVHVHFREPGMEEAETRATGAAAAAAGGFTCVTVMPNTAPAGDSPEWVRAQTDLSGMPCRILASACITEGRAGRKVADLEALAAAGAAFFTDDGSYVSDARVMEEAMRRAAKLGKTVCQHAVDPVLLAGGVIRDCALARRLNLPVMRPEAETKAVERDIAICRTTGCALHIQHVSCAGTVELVRSARREGLPVTCEASPHHLLFTCDDISGDDANWKMAPPLGNREDRAALREAVLDGTATCFATDHAPHPAAAKSNGFLRSANGITGLETAAAATWEVMVLECGMPAEDWIRRWTEGPAAIAGEDHGARAEKDCTVIDLEAGRETDPDSFRTKSRNQPYGGRVFRAWPVMTVFDGKVVYDGR